MAWQVDTTDEFQAWWQTLTEGQQEDVSAYVTQLEERGPNLRFPYCSGINGSKHGHMRELRVQSGGNPIRVFYAFNEQRTALLLLGGDKTGNDRFYSEMIPIVDALYDVHLAELAAEKAEQARKRAATTKGGKAKPHARKARKEKKHDR